MTNSPDSKRRSLGNLQSSEVQSTVDEYRGLYDVSEKKRKEQYATLVNHYYDLATDFYEFGWGKYFHFAPRLSGESFQQSLFRHQHYLADQLGLKQGMEVLDAGCGVGEPMENIGRYSGANMTGVNNNGYQIERAKKHHEDSGFTSRLIKGDFMKVPANDKFFHAVYIIEAAVHAPNPKDLYREMWRVLRSGGMLAS